MRLSRNTSPWIGTALLVATTLAFANVAHAQKTVFVGGQTNGGTELTTGFRAELNFNPRVGIEWAVSYNPETNTLTPFGRATSRRLFLSPSVIVNLIPRQPAIPYVVAGFGAVVQFASDFDDLEDGSMTDDEGNGSFRDADDGVSEVAVGRTLHVGAGVKYYFSDSLGVRFEVRYYNIDPDSFDELDVPSDTFDVPDLDPFGLTEFTAGFVWGF